MLNLTKPEYVMPVHGDHKHQAARGAGRGRWGAAVDLPGRERAAARDRLVARALRRRRAGGHDLRRRRRRATSRTSARDRRMLSADGIFIVVATISEQDGRSVVPPEVIFRGVLFIEEDDAFVAELRTAVDESPGAAPRRRSGRSTCSRTTSTTTLWGSVYERLRRRPMILPVVVEV